MADFNKAYLKTMKLEGGAVLHKVKGDKGGLTFGGIAKNYHPDWEGWEDIEAGNITKAKKKLKKFYLVKYWGGMKGHFLVCQETANAIYDYAVNAGVRKASKVAQGCCGAIQDGWIGDRTIGRLNAIDTELFLLRFSVARVAHRVKVCQKKPEQKKFLLGWVDRDIAFSKKGD